MVRLGVPGWEGRDLGVNAVAVGDAYGRGCGARRGGAGPGAWRGRVLTLHPGAGTG